MCTECKSCPFENNEMSNFLEGSCLPSPYEILKMKEISGNNWACHSSPEKMCAGFARSVHFDNQHFGKNIDIKAGQLINMASIHGVDRNIENIPESLRY